MAGTQAGTETGTLEGHCYEFASSDLVSYLFYITDDNLPKDDISHSGQGVHTSICKE